MPFITKAGLQQLDKYKYVGGSYTFLDNKMNHFWIFLSEYIPMNIAPNMITFVGFLFMISSYVTILFYDLTLNKQLPNWLFLKAGIEVFLYQTLDALDGKQARRTKSSSPLGQLFDHGCDSYTLTFILLCIAQACSLDNTIIFYLFLGAQFLMFQANWIEYHTHVLNTSYGNFGVTEVQNICITLLTIAGILGQESLMLPAVSIIPGFIAELMKNSSYQLFNDMISTSIGNFCGYLVIFQFIVVSIGTIIGTVSGFKGIKKITNLLQYLPIAQALFIVWQWCHTPIFEDYAGLMILSFGIMFSTITCKVITCSLTRMPLISFHIPTILYGIGWAIYKYTNLIQNDTQLFIVFIGLSIFNLLYSYIFVYGVINQITEYLGIYCFSLEKRERKKIE